MRTYILLCCIFLLSIMLQASNCMASAETAPNFAETEKAAKRGDAKAQAKLGEMYDELGNGPERMEKAVYWYRKSAEQGNADGQYGLGTLYGAGLGGLTPDTGKAMQLYEKAAEQGHADAQLALGLEYLVKRDKEKGCSYLRVSAEQGTKQAVETYNRQCADWAD